MQRLRLCGLLHALLEFLHLLDLRVCEVRCAFRDGEAFESLADFPELVQVVEVEPCDLRAHVLGEHHQTLVGQLVERFADL